MLQMYCRGCLDIFPRLAYCASTVGLEMSSQLRLVRVTILKFRFNLKFYFTTAQKLYVFLLPCNTTWMIVHMFFFEVNVFNTALIKYFNFHKTIQLYVKLVLCFQNFVLKTKYFYQRQPTYYYSNY
jgi:hypothetical protein